MLSPVPRLLTQREQLVSQLGEEAVEAGTPKDSLEGPPHLVHQHAQAEAGRQLVVCQVALGGEHVKAQGCETPTQKGVHWV